MFGASETRERLRIGAWRSPVARLNGVQEVPGSNPGAPTGRKPAEMRAFVHLGIPVPVLLLPLL